jgi:formylglycine-generating enzyme required for sulfatase activity
MIIKYPFVISGAAFFLAVCLLVSANAQTRGIPAGSFTMGTASGKPNEYPEHHVNLSAFSMDAFEVTREQYDSCVAAGACSPAHDDDGKCVVWNGRSFVSVRFAHKNYNPKFPIVCVTWNQAREYCSHKGKTLPTEAQWEYAALANRPVSYAWGNDIPDAAKCAQPRDGKPRQCGSFSPNPWGLYDMTGNVWEWVSDRYQPDYYSVSEIDDPPGPDVGQYRVIRGGGWYSGPAQLRIKNRHWFEPNFGELSIGFRCAK